MSPPAFAMPLPAAVPSVTHSASFIVPTSARRSLPLRPMRPYGQSPVVKRVAPACVLAPPKSPPSPPSPPSPSSTPSTPMEEPSQTDALPRFSAGVVHKITTPEQFDQLSEQACVEGAIIVADFMAAWCRKCLYLLTRFRKIAALNPTVYFCTIDVNKVNRLPRQFDIAKMPTFKVLKDGEVVATYVGGASPTKAAADLEALVNKFAVSR